ncbi:oncostatin-M-specific receptor subunit beta-like isoform X2 [Stegodyphus dumicola]|uniref:oncostatin-M-specific receptor subunit beta-like isoform X2 n=1 Tax=Stegodyphus dumicola TaxID=202533 RepID=UPI0015AFF841|nr:oncostatin-M-specific receptor subunit beta-like isoform X2 [Stegodyphus dumicola]
MFRRSCFLTLIPQMLLIALVACQSIPEFSQINPSFGLATRFTDVTPTSVKFHWKLPANTTYFCKPTRGMTYIIRYRPVDESDPEYMREHGFFPEESLDFPNLIPNTRYRFHILCRESDDKDYFNWKHPKTSYVRTLPDVPYWRPEIASSSFISKSEFFVVMEKHLLRKRNITLYWKKIPKEHENGRMFQYWIHVSNPYQSLVKEISTFRETTHTFTNMEPNIPYVFKIFAGNIVGNSSNSSQITVDPDTSLLETRIPSVYTHDYRYEIAWSGSGDEKDHYTLFWCKISHPPRPVRCQDSLEWLHLKSHGYVLYLPFKSIHYQFALSVNFENRTSGMLWAPCHVSTNNKVAYFVLSEICYKFITSVPTGSDVGMLYL